MTERRAPRLLVVADDETVHTAGWPLITLIESATDEEWSKLIEDIERSGQRVVVDRNEFSTVTDFREERSYWFEDDPDNDRGDDRP
jgi:hypothetical protein